MTSHTDINSNTAINSKHVLPRPLGPESFTWHDFGSYLFHLMLPQAFVLQSAHPIIDAAVSKEKKYKFDPWGRAKGSVALLWPVVYSRPEKAIEMGQRLRELHRQIKGIDAQGKPYHALDPEAYSWVHITGFDSTVRMYEYFGKQVSAEQRQQMFDEWKQMGSMLGILEQHIPQTEEAYWQHFNHIIENRLVWGEVVSDLMKKDFYAQYPKPSELKKLPDFVWTLFIHPVGWFGHKITVATLPEIFRRKFNIQYSGRDRLLFAVFSWLVRTFYPLTPQNWRYIPLAQRAINDARKNPEAYRVNHPLQPSHTKDNKN